MSKRGGNDPRVNGLLQQALTLHKSGNMAAADRAYSELMAIAPRFALGMNYWAVHALQCGRTDIALDRAEKSVKLDSKGAEILCNAGEICRVAGRLDRASAYLKKSLKRAPRNASALNNLGIVHRESGENARAIECFSRAIKLNPDNVDAIYNLAISLSETGRFRACAEKLEAVLAMRPGFADARVILADALKQGGRLSDAAEQLSRALADGDGLSKFSVGAVHNNLGSVYKSLRRDDKATECFEAAVAAEPGSPDIQAKYADWREQNGDVDKALGAANKALEIEPSHQEARMVLARIHMRDGEAEKARDVLEEALASHDSDTRHPSVYMDLGRIYDRLDDQEKAFAAWREGNERLSRSDKWRRQDGGDYLSQMGRIKAWIEKKPATSSVGSRAQADESVPAFLVGFPRSGTTLLETALESSGAFIVSDELPFLTDLIRAVPDIIGAEFRYPRDLDRLDDNAIGHLRDAYWERVAKAMGNPPRDRRLLDKLPFNLSHLGLVERLFPEAGVVMSLRDPRDVCLSNFMQNFEPNEATAMFLDLETTAKGVAAMGDLWLAYRSRLSLAWREVRYEETVADFETVLRGILDFLDAPWNDDVLRYFEKTKGRRITTPSARDVATPVYSRAKGRWEKYRFAMEPVLPILDPAAENLGYPT